MHASDSRSFRSSTAPTRDTGQDVDQAVRVRGDEIDGRVPCTQLVHRGRDRLPPPAGVASESEVAAADEPEHDPALLALDRGNVGVEAVAPRATKSLP